MAETEYHDLEQRILSLVEGEDDHVSHSGHYVVAELFHAVDGWDWVGFYRVTAPRL